MKVAARNQLIANRLWGWWRKTSDGGCSRNRTNAIWAILASRAKYDLNRCLLKVSGPIDGPSPGGRNTQGILPGDRGKEAVIPIETPD